jgi:adenylate kinase
MKNHFNRVRKGFAICVAGVAGAGKTTVLRAHVDSEIRDTQITGSSIVKAIIAPATVQEFDSWPSEKRDSVREQSIQRLRGLQAQSNGRLLVDGHFTLRNRISGELEPIFTAEDQSFFQALVLIHPSPEAVLSQRTCSSRNRGTESIETIAAHIEYERQEGRRLAQLMGVPLGELREADVPGRLRSLVEFLNLVAPLDSL